MPELTINGVRVDYEQSIRDDIRNTYLRFDESRLLLVSRKKIRDPQRLILKHRDWVLKHHAQELSRKRFFSQNRVLLGGAQYRVERQLYMGRPRVESNDSNFTITIKARDDKTANTALSRHIKKYTLNYVSAEAGIQAGKVGMQAKSIKVRRTKRWGACNSRRMLSFNSFLSMLPKDVSDYVVSHEVAHLKELNHSKRFWKIVAKLSPNYKKLRKELHRYDNTQRPVLKESVQKPELDYV